jgi:hypothetical protein
MFFSHKKSASAAAVETIRRTAWKGVVWLVKKLRQPKKDRLETCHKVWRWFWTPIHNAALGAWQAMACNEIVS